MEETVIKMNGIDYRIKKSFRALMIFEELSGKNSLLTNNSVSNILLFFYSIVKANNKIEFDFNSFVDMVDENPESVELFTNFIYKDVETKEETEKPKKKVSRSK